nr:helix-turn-helix domain-containing protein [Micromonospora sp. DSM 115978]
MLLVQLRYQFRVYPTPGQQIELARAFGCARVVFNDGLRLRQQAREAGEKYICDGEVRPLLNPVRRACRRSAGTTH